MSGKRKALLGAVVAALAAAIGIKWAEADRYPIEGVWMSLYHCQCLCNAQDFFLFESGRLFRYSDLHLTEYDAGSYQPLGDGSYRVTLASHSSVCAGWLVRLGRRSWVAPSDEDEAWFRRYLRRIYRPLSQSRARKLIASAAERDRIIAIRVGSSAPSGTHN